MKVKYNKLLLNWKALSSGKNYAIGVLERDHGVYTFFYNKEVLPDAEKEGFVPIIGFSDLEKVYKSLKLFSIFERRLPDLSRHSFRDFLDYNNLQLSNDDVSWEYLCGTKGRLATDSLSFMVPLIYLNSKSLLYLSCEVAGWSHTRNLNRDLNSSEKLSVIINEYNVHDKFAVELRDNSKNLVGYIPRPFNLLFYRLLKKNHYVTSNVYFVASQDKRPSVIIVASNVRRELVENEHDLQYLIEYQ